MDILMTSALFVILLAIASIGLRVIEGMERENRLVEAELETSQLYRESLGSRAELVRRYRHDADGLLRAIEYSIDPDERVENAETPLQLKGADGALTPLGAGSHQLPLADAAVQSKRRLCADAGIEFPCTIDPAFAEASIRKGVSEVDLCIALQNLLDNAYEESLRAKAAGAGPMMSLELACNPDGLSITVANRTASTTPPEFRTHKAQPELHGVGLQVVRDIVREHDGNLASSFDAETHILAIMATLRS